jgi:hypothetical protein
MWIEKRISPKVSLQRGLKGGVDVAKKKHGGFDPTKKNEPIPFRGTSSG